MHVTIQKVLFGRVHASDVEAVISGGESAQNVLYVALGELLRQDPAKVQSWEALSVTIAQRKARSALQRATKGRRSAATPPNAPDDIGLVSLDDVGTDRPDENEGTDPEAVFMRNQQQLVILRLARQLDERKRKIFFAVHYEGRDRKDVGEELGISGQAVGQAYVKIAKGLLAAAMKDPEYPTLRGTPDGRTDD
jgi:DNA-directed RNA polymerase specialized sigma24 family protein